MTRFRFILGLTFGILALAGGSAVAQHDAHGDMVKQHASEKKAEASKLPLCPIMGDPIDFTVSTRTDDGPVYFCCAMCIKKFERQPAEYAKQVAEQRAQLKQRERVQVACPISGEAVDKNVSVKVDGREVFFCCGGCASKYKAEPKKYEGALEGSYTYQTRCPVMGSKIDPASFTELANGQRIYYCCPGCDKKFVTNPEKYAKSLQEQGLGLSALQLKKELAKKVGGYDHDGHGHGEHDGHDHP